MYEFTQLTRSDPSHKNLSCDLILSSAGIVIPNQQNVFDHAIDLREFGRGESDTNATAAAHAIFDYL